MAATPLRSDSAPPGCQGSINVRESLRAFASGGRGTNVLEDCKEFLLNMPACWEAFPEEKDLAKPYTDLIKNVRKQGIKTRRSVAGKRREQQFQQCVSYENKEDNRGLPRKSGIQFGQGRNQHIKNAVDHQKPNQALQNGRHDGFTW